MPAIRLIKFTAQVDVATIARSMFPHDTPHILYTTWVDYADDPVTRMIFKNRLHDFDVNGNLMRHVNDPHSLAAIANDNIPPEYAVILDGLHFLTSNLMLLTNSDEDATLATAEKLVDDELMLLDALHHIDVQRVTVISADVSADAAMRQTFQGRTYQKLLAQANRTASQRLREKNTTQFVALSAGLIQEYPT